MDTKSPLYIKVRDRIATKIADLDHSHFIQDYHKQCADEILKTKGLKLDDGEKGWSFYSKEDT